MVLQILMLLFPRLWVTCIAFLGFGKTLFSEYTNPLWCPVLIDVMISLRRVSRARLHITPQSNQRIALELSKYIHRVAEFET